jgi:predicted DCC family thiol-disulfide oxidoreductase YuxK
MASGSRERAPRAAGPSADDTWIVFYDDDCGLCMWLLAKLLRMDRARRLRPLPLQGPRAEAALHDLTAEERMASWHLVSPGGERTSAGAALAPLFALLPRGRTYAAAFARFPRTSERGYRWVADHRSALSKLVPSGPKAQAARYVRARVAG